MTAESRNSKQSSPSLPRSGGEGRGEEALSSVPLSLSRVPPSGARGSAKRSTVAISKKSKAASADVVFLFDVDNTLLNNDAVTADLHKHLEAEVAEKGAKQYWALFEKLREERGYADYLGALQQFRIKYPHDHRILTVSHFLIEYPFANRLFPGALDAIEKAKSWGTTALLTDGDVVFQPRKIERSGLLEAVEHHVLVYIHKEHELRDVVKNYSAKHYIVVDDKLRILTAIKKIWKTRVTTVFVRQGHYALDPKIVANLPPADVTLERISEFAQCNLEDLLGASKKQPL